MGGLKCLELRLLSLSLRINFALFLLILEIIRFFIWLMAVLMLRRLFARFLNMCMVTVILIMCASVNVMVGMYIVLR